MVKKRRVTVDGGNGASRQVTRATPEEVRRDDANGRYDLRPLTGKSRIQRLEQRRRLARRLQNVLATEPQPEPAVIIMSANDSVIDSGCGDISDGGGALPMEEITVLQDGGSLDTSVEVHLQSGDCSESVPSSVAEVYGEADAALDSADKPN